MGDRQHDVLKSLWRWRSLADRSGMVLGVLRSVWFTKRIQHTWKVGKGTCAFNSDLIYDSELYTEKYATGRASSPIWYT